MTNPQATHFSAAVKSAHRKMAVRILPFVALMYMLSFLDRVNIGFAKQQLEADLGIGHAAYGLGAGIFFIGYVLFEVPSNLILHRVGARRWLARIMVTWGALSFAMMFMQGALSFYILRFLLGFAEAGLFPGVVLYLTYWYAKDRRSAAIGTSVYWGLAVSFIVGGPISEALLSMDGTGDMAGWQWMFAVQGGLTVLIGIIAFFYLVEKPADAPWLTPAEKMAVSESVRAEDQTRLHISPLKALGNPKVLYLGAIFFCINLSLYGLTFWLPSLIRNIDGLTGLTRGLLAGLPWIFALISVFVVTRLADRTGKHSKAAAGCLTVMAIGLALSASVGPALGLAFICVAACGLLCALPTFWNLPTSYLSGAAAAAGIALINTIGNISGFIAPYAFGLIEAATGSVRLGFYLLSCMALVGAAMLLAYRKGVVAPEQHSAPAPGAEPLTEPPAPAAT